MVAFNIYLFIKGLQCARDFLKHFLCIKSFNNLKNPIR